MKFTKLFVMAIVVVAALPWGRALAGENQLVQLPTDVGEGKAKEVNVLLDQEHLKLATITLRNGTALPIHSAPVPATIQVLEGEGIIHVAGKPLAVSQGSIVVLAAGEEHDVVPKDDGDISVLVHYLRGTGKDDHKDHKGHSQDHGHDH